MTTEVVRIGVAGLDDGPEAGFGPAVLAGLDPARHVRTAIAFHHAESGAYRTDLYEAVLRGAPPEDGEERFAAVLLAAARRARLQVIVPGVPRLVAPLARCAAAFRKAGICVVAPEVRQLPRLWAGGAIEWVRRRGAPVAVVHELPRHARPVDFPAVWPHALTVVADDGSQLRCSDVYQAMAFERGCRARHLERVVLIEVDPFSTCEVAVVCGPGGRPRASVAVRVLADDDRGRPWAAVTLAAPALEAAAAKVCGHLAVSGPLVLTFTGSAEPRFAGVRFGWPMWAEAAQAAGVNLVEVGVRLARGAKVARPPVGAAGILFSQTAEDLVVDLARTVELSRCTGDA